ncbi:MAG: prepilin-type N-terminal cleavage/methylation domain-containing protein [Kiritimatiellia bacterium]|jgi:prepilin-type N-terminal cleavage/methylation domain-containing protein
MKKMSMNTISNSKKGNAGFTLLEILISLTIIMVLASISLPSYQRYVIRAEATAIVSAFEPFKLAHDLLLQEHTSGQGGPESLLFKLERNGDSQYCLQNSSTGHACISPYVTYYSAADSIIPGTDLALGAGYCFFRCNNYKINVRNSATSAEGIVRGNRLAYEFAMIMEPNANRINYATCMSSTSPCIVSLVY